MGLMELGKIIGMAKRAMSLIGGHPRDPALAEFYSGGMTTASGSYVTPDTAMQTSAVFGCIRILAETLASIPLVLYRRTADGGKERAVGHRLYNVLGAHPNRIHTRFEWIEMAMAHCNLRGVHYSRIVTNNAGKVSLIPLHPERILAQVTKDNELIYKYYSPEGPTEHFVQDEILRVPFLTLVDWPYYVPISPITAQREAIGASMAAADYGARFWQNDAKPGTWIGFDGKFKDAQERKAFLASYNAGQSGQNRHKTAVFEKGFSLHELGMSNVDSQFLESRRYQRGEIAGIFRIPPHLLGDIGPTSRGNIEHLSLEFVIYTMRPWCERFAQAMNRDLLTDAETGEYFFEFDVSDLLRGDNASRSQFYKDAIYSGWLSRNEVRDMENRNAVDGLDEYIVPVNMTPSDMLAKQLLGSQQQKKPPQAAMGGKDDGTS